jgi:hypothetical protein
MNGPIHDGVGEVRVPCLFTGNATERAADCSIRGPIGSQPSGFGRDAFFDATVEKRFDSQSLEQRGSRLIAGGPRRREWTRGRGELAIRIRAGDGEADPGVPRLLGSRTPGPIHEIDRSTGEQEVQRKVLERPDRSVLRACVGQPHLGQHVARLLG